MPRISRVTPGGMVFHVLNRGAGRQALFRKPADYSAFEDCVHETLDKVSMRICAYCLMPNHVAAHGAQRERQPEEALVSESGISPINGCRDAFGPD